MEILKSIKIQNYLVGFLIYLIIGNYSGLSHSRAILGPVILIILALSHWKMKCKISIADISFTFFISIGLCSSLVKHVNTAHFVADFTFWLFTLAVWFFFRMISKNKASTFTYLNMTAILSLLFIQVMIINSFLDPSIKDILYFKKQIYLYQLGGHVNYLGSIISICIPLLFLHWDKRNSLQKLGLLIVAVVAYYFVFTSISQTSIIASSFAMLMIIFTFLLKKSTILDRLSRKIKLIILCSVPMFFTLILLTNKRAFLSEWRGMATRFDIWETTVQMIYKNPILGLGFGQWKFNISKFDFPPAHIGHVHNFYLEIGTEAGFIGLLFFILFIGFVLFSVWKNKSFQINNILLFISIISALTVGLTFGILSPTYGRYKKALLILIACLAVLDQSKTTFIPLRQWILPFFIIPYLIFGTIFFNKKRKQNEVYKLKDYSVKIYELDKLYDPVWYTHIKGNKSISSEIIANRKYIDDPNLINKHLNLELRGNTYNVDRMKQLAKVAMELKDFRLAIKIIDRIVLEFPNISKYELYDEIHLNKEI